MLDRITPIILTYNEEPNLHRLLTSLQWAHRIVVVDSGSTDQTVRIAESFANVAVINRAFDSHAAQWNHGLTATAIDTDWVLALDADYVVPAAAVKEMSSLGAAQSVSGYRAAFRYCIHGRPLSGSLYPPVTVLFRRERGRYVQEGHTQRLQIDGEVRSMSSVLDHDDRKPLSRWLVSQEKYATLEADMLLQTSWGELGWQDRLRSLMVITPWLVPLYVLTVKRCIFDGRAGWHYVLQRGIAEAILSLKLLEFRLFRTDTRPKASQ